MGMEYQPLRLTSGASLKRSDGMPLIMGILNVTPDSFSDGGKFQSPGAALEQAQKLVAEGADIIDVGAESSRPGAEPLSADQEWERLSELLPQIVESCKIPVSIDTYHAQTAKRAIECGAAIINDISGGSADAEMFKVAAETDAPIILMHMQGSPVTMQSKPAYSDVVSEVLAFLSRQRSAVIDQGVKAERVVVDPGFGFGKSVEHNIELVRKLAEFRELGPVLLGLSRKSTLAALADSEDLERLPESIAGALVGAQHGADILRVHDVRATVRALKVGLSFAV